MIHEHAADASQCRFQHAAKKSWSIGLCSVPNTIECCCAVKVRLLRQATFRFEHHNISQTSRFRIPVPLEQQSTVCSASRVGTPPSSSRAGRRLYRISAGAPLHLHFRTGLTLILDFSSCFSRYPAFVLHPRFGGPSHFRPRVLHITAVRTCACMIHTRYSTSAADTRLKRERGVYRASGNSQDSTPHPASPGTFFFRRRLSPKVQHLNRGTHNENGDVGKTSSRCFHRHVHRSAFVPSPLSSKAAWRIRQSGFGFGRVTCTARGTC